VREHRWFTGADEACFLAGTTRDDECPFLRAPFSREPRCLAGTTRDDECPFLSRPFGPGALSRDHRRLQARLLGEAG